jgi:lipopolysaccharide transport system permease protein
LPLIIGIQVIFILGLMFFISYLSVLVRDVPQLVNVLLQLLFYITPIIYPLETIPPDLRFWVQLNPMTALVRAFQAVTVYQKPPDMVSLYYPLVVGCVLLYMGYQFFKRYEKRLADML